MKRASVLSWLSVLIGVVLLGPLLVIVGSIFFDTEDLWNHLAATVLPEYVTNSFLLVAGTTIGAILIGTPVAGLVTLCNFPGRRIFEWALLLPLAVPTYLIAYTYTDLLEFAGPVQTWFREVTGLGFREYWFPNMRSLGGAIFTFSFVLYPYVYLLARAAFIEQSVCVLEASRTLGENPLTTFFRVGVPLARPAIAGGAVLVAMETLADYGAVDYFAVDTFTTGIYRTRFGLGSAEGAAQLAALLLVIVAFLVVVEKVLRGRKRYHHSTNRYRELPRWQISGWLKVMTVVGLSIPVTLGFIVPAGVLLELAWSTAGKVDWERVQDLAKHSFLLATMSGVLALGVAVLLSYAVRLDNSRLARGSARAVALGYSVPGSVIAIGVMVSFGLIDEVMVGARSWLWGSAEGWLLSGSVAALVLAYLTRFSGVALQAIDSGLSKIQPSMDAAGRTLGEAPLGMLRRVHLPLLRSSILAGGLLVFVDVLKELPATMIIRPFNFETLAVRVHHLASDERLGEAAVPALLIVAVGLIPVVLLSRIMGESRAGGKTGGHS